MVLPAALDFLLDFNADEFQTEIRARDYYTFVALDAAVARACCSRSRSAILAPTRLGITTPEKLRKNRRYAILVIAVAGGAACPAWTR